MKNKKIFMVVVPILILLIAGFIYYTNYKVYSVISIDVNPSFELNLNSKDKVIDIVALNTDAETFLEDFKMEDKDVDAVVESMTTKLMTQGFLLDETSNMILTVRSQNREKINELQESVRERVQNRLVEKNSEANVYNQGIASEDMNALKETAEANDVSLGKTLFITRILKTDSTLSFEDLAEMDQKELVDIAKEKSLKQDLSEGESDTPSQQNNSTSTNGNNNNNDDTQGNEQQPKQGNTNNQGNR